MRLVSLLAPDSIVGRELREAYAPLVTASLLADWQRNPQVAPGRRTSNPWPVRIDVDSMQRTGAECRVDGVVVEVTSADTTTAVDRVPVTLRLQDQNGWRISAFAMFRPAPATAGDTAAPAAIVRRYYADIQVRQYDDAYALWGNHGQASGQSRADFAAGFAQTAQVHVTIGDSVRVEGAAGSQYAAVPVVVDALLKNGERQRFTGTYTLRRVMVDGASADERRWHIERAELKAAP